MKEKEEKSRINGKERGEEKEKQKGQEKEKKEEWKDKGVQHTGHKN